MTPRDRIADVRARLAAATPGPWTTRTRPSHDPRRVLVEGHGGQPVARVEGGGDPPLVVNAPSDLADLCALAEAVGAWVAAGARRGPAPEGWVWEEDEEVARCARLVTEMYDALGKGGGG